MGQQTENGSGLAGVSIRNSEVAGGSRIVYDRHMNEHDPSMAPANLGWHMLYVRNSMEIIQLLDDLQNHPDFKDAEDLGDWVETVATLMSFRPHTRDDIELEVRKEWHDARG